GEGVLRSLKMGAGSSTAGAGNSKTYPSSHPVRPVYFRENRTVLRRFIPAGAGNTHQAEIMYVFSGGLSPLARGTLAQP
ncbi:hypothetical protein, partial [Escherichia coli]|uniref:hypothetical protein n=1 Tax=Escherichia coli TaxID=562 RepID=UPI001BC864EC